MRQWIPRRPTAFPPRPRARISNRPSGFPSTARESSLSTSFAPRGARMSAPRTPASERRLVGRPVRALDIAAKTNGSGRYGIDAKVPDMVYARPKIPPTRNGSKVISVDDSQAQKVKGYIRSIVLDDPSDTVPGWVMVIAESYPAAIRAADLVTVSWASGPGPTRSDNDITEKASQLVWQAHA